MFNKNIINAPNVVPDTAYTVALFLLNSSTKSMAGGVGQAKVFTADELTRVFQAIGARKHPERNLCVVLLSFALGLRAQEIALLENQFLLDISDQHSAGFEVASELTI